MNNFINLSLEEQWSCISPHIKLQTDFKELTNPIVIRTYKDCIKKILGLNKLKKRSEDFVKNAYDDKWISRDSQTSIDEGGNVGVTWKSSRFVVSGLGLRRLQTLRIMKLIEKIKPKSVLDIGCGNGERILQLACRFPEIKFTGIDLTTGGIETAKKIQNLKQLTDSLIEISPQPLIDLTAHKQAKFICSSAKNIPFQDNSFDLVYTSLALEQMETIRGQVMKEIYRVCNQHVSFYEAFKDYNKNLLQLSYIYSQSYFRGELNDLFNLGYQNIEVMIDIPQKINMNAVFVLAKK